VIECKTSLVENCSLISLNLLPALAWKKVHACRQKSRQSRGDHHWSTLASQSLTLPGLTRFSLLWFSMAIPQGQFWIISRKNGSAIDVFDGQTKVMLYHTSTRTPPASLR
jgi:hypothetical protein